MNIVTANTPEYEELFTRMKARRLEADRAVSRSVEGIISQVRADGWEAVRRFSLEFDRAEPQEIKAEEWDRAVAACDPALIDTLKRAATGIEAYQKELLCKTKEWCSPHGGQVGVLVRGLTRVGIYVPGGTAAYPSSVLMNAIPARVAGVGEIIMVTPPREFLSPAVLAAARIAGVNRVFAVGGVQAVAALAFGAGDIPAADKIVGPGNAYVAEAKRQLFGIIDIDMIAGPSEVLVLADHSADPVFVAADLLSQAEHDPMAGALLVTTSQDLASEVLSQIELQKKLLPRRVIIEASLRDYGAVVLCENLTQAAQVANRAAPEHLEILTENPREVLPLIQNAGAIFLGPYSPEPLGDYMAGPSHVLPTSGTARFFSPLSVDSFLKKTSLIEFSQSALEGVWQDVRRLAEEEGLFAHANSMTVRFHP